MCCFHTFVTFAAQRQHFRWRAFLLSVQHFEAPSARSDMVEHTMMGWALGDKLGGDTPISLFESLPALSVEWGEGGMYMRSKGFSPSLWDGGEGNTRGKRME